MWYFILIIFCASLLAKCINKKHDSLNRLLKLIKKYKNNG